MRNDLDTYYAMFNDRDAERVAAFDRIMDAPLGEELKAKIMQWYSVAKSSISGLGDRGAKVLVMAVVEMATMTPQEQEQAITIGKMINAAAPEAWRVK
jgi:hypothetical protein